MRFGMDTEMQCPPEKPHEQLYWKIQRQIEHADAMSFDVYCTIDHHFSQEFGISRLRLRTRLSKTPTPGEMAIKTKDSFTNFMRLGDFDRLNKGVQAFLSVQ